MCIFPRFTAWFLFKLLGRLLTSIQIHKGQIDFLKEACQVRVVAEYINFIRWLLMHTFAFIATNPEQLY